MHATEPRIRLMRYTYTNRDLYKQSCIFPQPLSREYNVIIPLMMHKNRYHIYGDIRNDRSPGERKVIKLVMDKMIRR